MLNDNFFINLGINIKKRRKRLGLSQQNLADKAGLSLNFIGKIEVAFSKPSIDTIINIAEALELTVSELSDFEDK